MSAAERGAKRGERAMPYYDYKVVPAPRRMKKVRGVNDSDELLAMTLTEAINEHARQGWEYVRAESLSAETPGGWLRRGRAVTQTLLVFRQPRETLGPRLAAAEAGAPAGHPAPTRVEPRPEPRPEPVAVRVPGTDQEPRAEATPIRPVPQRTDRPFVDRVQGLGRREPAVELPAPEPSAPTPLRPNPRLGPAGKD